MIAVIDYGMGNLRSVSKALEHYAKDVRVTSNPNDIKNASKVVLPGVGAFGDCIRELTKRRLIELLKDILARGEKPYLGICLGLQILFSGSEENPDVPGLSVFNGQVVRFSFKEHVLKIPHMGWNEVKIKKKDSPILGGVPDKSYFYFVHSYYGVPEDSKIITGETTYGNIRWASVISKPPIYAIQFHPEKSQQVGLKILENFVRL